ncbi:unnamed protein product [Urochloa humidicola]
MEELDEFEVLWPDTCGHALAPPPPPASPSPVPVHVLPSSEPPPAAARSRPVDIPTPKAPARARRWNGDHDGGGAVGNAKDIVPPHLLLSGMQAASAWTLRPSGVGRAVQT